VPATIGILNGVARVGLLPNELIELASRAEKKDALKVSRRDLGYICGLVGPLSSLSGTPNNDERA
jgi:pseudouridine-5'-phosphate glycosidase/pseudouridine kinase